MLAIFDQAWEYAYGWLGCSLLLNLADPGRFAAADDFELESQSSAPTVDRRVAAVVPFLSSVFVPILAMLHAGFLDGIAGSVVAAIALLAALYRLAYLQHDNEPSRSQPSSHHEGGLPAIWSILGFYFHAFDATPLVAVLVIGLAIVLTLLPNRWPSLISNDRFQPLTRLLSVVWLLAGAVTLLKGFPALVAAKAVFLAVTACMVLLAALYARDSSRTSVTSPD